VQLEPVLNQPQFETGLQNIQIGVKHLKNLVQNHAISSINLNQNQRLLKFTTSQNLTKACPSNQKPWNITSNPFQM
jgi:hypothetical protein